MEKRDFKNKEKSSKVKFICLIQFFKFNLNFRFYKSEF